MFLLFLELIKEWMSDVISYVNINSPHISVGSQWSTKRGDSIVNDFLIKHWHIAGYGETAQLKVRSLTCENCGHPAARWCSSSVNTCHQSQSCARTQTYSSPWHSLCKTKPEVRCFSSPNFQTAQRLDST